MISQEGGAGWGLKWECVYDMTGVYMCVCVFQLKCHVSKSSLPPGHPEQSPGGKEEEVTASTNAPLHTTGQISEI